MFSSLGTRRYSLVKNYKLIDSTKGYYTCFIDQEGRFKIVGSYCVHICVVGAHILKYLFVHLVI